VQGKGAADWITFVLEPQVLGEARLGYEDVLNPGGERPAHGRGRKRQGRFLRAAGDRRRLCGSETIARDLKAMNVRDSKTITTDKAAQDLAKKIRARLGDRFTVVAIGPAAYNRLYDKMGSVNRILAWGHAQGHRKPLGEGARLPARPERPVRTRAADPARPPAEGAQDQAGAAPQGRKRRGRGRRLHPGPIRLSLRHGEARRNLAGFAAQGRLRQGQGRGRRAGEETRRRRLLETAKCHFKTTDDVLGPLGKTRSGEGLPPAPEKKVFVPRKSSK
jgi:hypothetical protein